MDAAADAEQPAQDSRGQADEEQENDIHGTALSGSNRCVKRGTVTRLVPFEFNG